METQKSDITIEIAEALIRLNSEDIGRLIWLLGSELQYRENKLNVDNFFQDLENGNI